MRSRPRLRAFRITNLGTWCLGLTSEFRPTQPSSSLELTVLPNLSIRVQAGSPLPAEKLQLETWAEAVEPGVWRLDPTRARDAVERGQNIGDFAAFLERCDNQPLPETVQGFLRTCESDGKALRSLGEAWLFDCRDPETTEMISGHEQLQDLCHRCGETRLAVPAADLTKFRTVVRALGLGVS